MATYDDTDGELGGESSCYAHLLCEECGAVLDGLHDPHRTSDATVDADENTH